MLNVPLTAPAGSVGLGTLVLKPVVKGATAGTISFLSAAAPADVQKLKRRAQNNAKEGKWKEAQRSLEAAVKKYDSDPESWLGLGIAHQRQNSLVEARAAFEKAVAIDPRFAPPLIELALMALQQRDWPSAIHLGDRALKISPSGFPEARVYLATAYLNTGDYIAAERESRKAIAAVEGSPKAHHLLGVALAKQGRVTEAIQELQQFLLKAPNAPDAATVRQHIRMLQEQGR